MEDRLKNYFMKPTNIEYIGNLYPIRLFEYEEFRELASKYIISGRKWFTNIYKYPKDEFILDYYIKMCMQMKDIKRDYETIQNMKNTEGIEEFIKDSNIDLKELDSYEENLKGMLSNLNITYSISEIEKLFSLIMRKKVIYEEFSYDKETDVIDYIFNIEGEEDKITKYNFEQFRETVMLQNLLYEPLTSPSEEGNKIIQEALEALSSGGITPELESICSTVSVYKSIGDEELYNYTYYRLMVDFESIVRINDNIFIYLLRSQGCNEYMPNHLSEKIKVYKNPYDGVMDKYKASSIDKRLKQG